MIEAPLNDWSDWATDRDVRRREIDHALQQGRWEQAKQLLGQQGDSDSQLRRWLDKAIVGEKARG